MMLSKIIPNYILINGIAIGGTVFVIFLVYRKLSSSFQKRLTAYFLKAACVSLVISLVVLAVVLAMMQLLLHSGMWSICLRKFRRLRRRALEGAWNCRGTMKSPCCAPSSTRCPSICFSNKRKIPIRKNLYVPRRKRHAVSE